MKIEMKTTKKILIIMVMAIAMLLILPKNEFAYSYKSISGQTYNDNKEAAGFFSRLQNYSAEDLKNQNIVRSWMGTDMGDFEMTWDPKWSNSQFAASAMKRRIRE